MSECLFCKIVNRQIPAKIVYEDERVVVIEDINPQAPLHVLVIPKTHIASLNDVTPGQDGLIGEMNRRAAGIARDSQSLHELSDEFEPEEFPTLDQQPTTRD